MILMEPRRAFPIILVIGCALLIGCSRQGPERIPISGTITYNGEPLKEGNIRFTPLPGTQAPVSATTVIDGRYSAVAHGGVAVGKYKIEIMAYRLRKDQPAEAAAKEFPGANLRYPSVVQYIPEKYNLKTELEITIPSGSDAISKDFELVD